VHWSLDRQHEAQDTNPFDRLETEFLLVARALRFSATTIQQKARY
jgi:hypothetical protein